MCGICGLVGQEVVEESLLRRMNDALAHRGPDGEGYFLKGPVGLAMRRLAIIDLETGDQPIFNEDESVVIVFNGEIYNYRELREELLAKGHHFATRSDTETIVHAYEEWGLDCPAHLNGMFAFAIWDSPKGRLFVARDQLGIKPLYYAALPGGALAFASELKALRPLPGWSRRVDPIALDQYLAMRYIPAPRTIHEGVRKLPPAHSLTLAGGKLELRRYWGLSFAPMEGRDDEEWAAGLRALLADAVRRQMIADVPLGAFLSGGIDSSIVVALMAQSSAQPVRTFSVVFPGWPGFDESAFARAVAARWDTEHTEIAVEARVAEELPNLVWAFDEPFADPAALPTLLMARETRRQVTVVLTGEGADELFAGYGWYGWAGRRLPLPTSVKKPLRAALQSLWAGRRGLHNLTARLAPDFATMYVESVLSSSTQSALRRELYRPDWLEQLDERELCADFAALLAATSRAPEQCRMQELDLKIWLEGDPLVKADRTTMAVSLEGRVPFLDYRVAELAARIPPRLQRRGGQSKALLRRACADLLPPEVLSRPKHAFDVPVSDWLRGELKPLALESLSENCLPALRPEVVRRHLQEHLAGRRDHGRMLWTLLNLALWQQSENER